MTINPTSPLSKTRFSAGLQCLKRLFMECFDRELADPIDTNQQALFDSGNAVGELARQRFPGGRLIKEEYFEHARAVASTLEVLADSSIPTVYEAAFASDGIRIRTDILYRSINGGFDLIEVKSSTSVKQEHIPDVAIQLHVLESSGIPVGKAYLMHVDNSYVYQGGSYNLTQLFRLTDVTGLARAFLASTAPQELAGMWYVLEQDDAPEIDIGPQCTKPYRCGFYGYCHRDEPEHSIEQLPRAGAQLLQGLRETGIRDIREIPSGYPGLSTMQQRVRDCVASGQPWASQDLSNALGGVEYPLHFLDFETFNPALPIYSGTRPYQVLPFQWSLHTWSSSGQLRHQSYLHDGDGDPRGSLAESLLEAIGSGGTIVVYSGYEETMVKQLAAAYPEQRGRLLSLTRRMFDLLKVLRAHYYHPDFHGSYSIKAVLPALVPEMTYSNLEIQDGSSASVAFAKMLRPDTGEPEHERIRTALLDYCRMDTEAMLRVFAMLGSLSR